MIARLGRAILIALVFVGLWEAARRFSGISPLILASPSDMIIALYKSHHEFAVAFRVTVVEIFTAIAISWPLGLSIGLIVGRMPYAAAMMGPIFSSLFAIPLITWYPLLMIWLGIGSSSKIVYAVISGFFPIVLHTLSAVRNLDEQYIRFGRSIGVSRLAIAVKILLPLALPTILAGLRIGTALIVIGVLVTEMLASLGGLGFLITYHRNLYETGYVYAGIALSLICVAIVNTVLSHLERKYAMSQE